MINLIMNRNISWSRLFTLVVFFFSFFIQASLSSSLERMNVFAVDENNQIENYESKSPTSSPVHRIQTEERRWNRNTLSFLCAPECRKFNSPGDIVITEDNEIIVADQLYIYKYDEPFKSAEPIAPKSTELKKSPNYMSRKCNYMGQSASGDLFTNNDGGLYHSKFSGGQLFEAMSLKLHAENFDHISDAMVIDNDKATFWFVESGYLYSYSYSYGSESEIEKAYEIHGTHGNKESSAVVGYGSMLYTAMSIKDDMGIMGIQQKLIVSASELNKLGRTHWAKTIKSVEVANKRSFYNYSPEIAVNRERVFVLCSHEIFILNRQNSEILFHKRMDINADELLLKGLVISENGHLFTQGKYGIYSISNDLVFTYFSYADSELPAQGMIITDTGQLLALSLINNGIYFAVQPALSSECCLGRKQAAVIMRVFNIDSGGTLSLDREEQPICLPSLYAGRRKKEKDARPWWRIGSPTLSDSGNLYVSLNSITDLGGERYTSGTDLVLVAKIELRLSSTAPWPKQYRDNKNTNWAPAVEVSSQKLLGEVELTLQQPSISGEL